MLSVIGSYLFCLYGWLREDFAIVLGQFISYYIYIWNINAKGKWRRLPAVVRLVLVLTPVVALGFVALHVDDAVQRLFRNDRVPLWLLIYGSAGQVLFTLRFVYQWVYSRGKGESTLPAGFWIISLTGSLCIVTYGIIRMDVVLMVGQSFGIVSYMRNLILIHREKKQWQ